MTTTLSGRRWLLPAGWSDYLIARPFDVAASGPGRVVPGIFVTAHLDRWLSGPAAETLFEVYEALGGRRPVGLTVFDRTHYDQQLRRRLEQAFDTGELIALEVQRPALGYVARRKKQQAPPPAAEPTPESSFIGVQLVDGQGNPVPGARFRLTFPDGSTRDGRLNTQGCIHVEGVTPGTCQISFPDFDGDAWAMDGA